MELEIVLASTEDEDGEVDVDYPMLDVEACGMNGVPVDLLLAVNLECGAICPECDNWEVNPMGVVGWCPLEAGHRGCHICVTCGYSEGFR